MPYLNNGKWGTHEEDAEEKGVNAPEKPKPPQPPRYSEENRKGDRDWLGLYKDDNYPSLAQVMPNAYDRMETLRLRYGLQVSPRLADEIADCNRQEWGSYVADDPRAKRYNEKYGTLPPPRVETKLKEITAGRPELNNPDGSLNEEQAAKACDEAAEAVAKETGFSPPDFENEDYIKWREKEVQKRGYGYARDSLSNSMNLPRSH
jgi:hypothetical protein